VAALASIVTPSMPATPLVAKTSHQATKAVIGDASTTKAEKWLEATYPGLYDWLHEFKDAGAERQDVGDYWWELRACDYYDAFEQPKIVWPDISKLPRFSMDSGSHFLGNTGYMIPLENYFLLGLLSSWPMWFVISRICQPLRLRGGRWQYRLFRQFMERLPVPKELKAAERDTIASLAKRCNNLGPECYRLEREVLKRIRNDLIPADKKTPLVLQQWWQRNFDVFKEQIETLQRRKLAGQVVVSWEARLVKEQASRRAIRAQIESAEPDYFHEAGIGDFGAYFRRARRLVKQGDTPAGVVLFNLLEEVMVRNTRPYIRAAYPNATIKGKPVAFPNRRLHTVEYDLGKTYGGLYDEIVAAIDALSLAPYKLEAYKKKSAIADEERHKFDQGREEGLVGIFKTRFLKRLESSIEAFRLSLRRALTFEETYKDYLLDRKVVSSRDFQKAIRYLARDEEDDIAAGSVADELDAVAEAKTYIASLPTVDLNEYDLRKRMHDVEADVKTLQGLYERTEALAARDGKLGRLKDLLAGDLRGQKVLIFSTFKDTTRYLHRRLTEDGSWLNQAGSPHIRRIDSGNHPDERGHIIAQFAPQAHGVPSVSPGKIDILISTDVLSEGQNLQDCGVLINYDLTWNPIRLVQRNGRIDRIGSPHAEIGIYNLVPEDELKALLHLVERLASRISTIDDLGLLDASVLGEVVHPRTFNTIRRIREEDGTVLDEEEARAELAGPELLLKQLKDLLNRDGANTLTDLPNGIHSGLRREKGCGMFFYFQAPRAGEGKRHFWRYIDARTHEIWENRYEIAQVISCLPDEPRYLGDQNVFIRQERVIEQILAAEREVEAKAAAPAAVDPIQQTVTEEIKNAIRRRTVDREKAKAGISFLGQPTGRALHARLKTAHDIWITSRDDATLVGEVVALAGQFGKQKPEEPRSKRLSREDLDLICFEYVTG
jgi:superfamily II DNA or RNA helicase